MKLANDEEKSLWREAAANSAEAVDDDGIPLDMPEQVAAACSYADAMVEEYRKRL